MPYIFKGWSPPKPQTALARAWKTSVYILAALGAAVLLVIIIDLIPSWRNQVLRLSWRAWSNMLPSIGHTGLGIAIFLFIFPTLKSLYSAATSRRFKEVVMAELRKSLAPDLIIGIAVLTVLFGWSLTRTVHDDHRDLADYDNRAKSEKEQLELENKKLHDRISELETRALSAPTKELQRVPSSINNNLLKAQLDLEYAISIDLLYQEKQLRIYNHGRTNILLWGTQFDDGPRDIGHEPRLISPSPTTPFGLGETYYYLKGDALEQRLVEKFGKDANVPVHLKLFVQDQRHDNHTVKCLLMVTITRGVVKIETQNLGVVDGW